MHIVQLTPGTGSFYCGSCLRDIALVRALQAQGHEVTLVPMYLPLVLDYDLSDLNVQRVQCGGISMYLQQKYALFRKLPRFLSTMFDRPWLLRRTSKLTGMTDPHELGAMTVSMMQGRDGKQGREIDALVDMLGKIRRPDVVVLSNILLVGAARAIRDRLNVPVVSTLQGEDTFIDELPKPWNDRAWDTLRERAADLTGVIPVSQYYADTMSRRLNIPAERMHVVPNGIDPAACTGDPQPSSPPVIGYLSRMIPDKGLHTLVDAFIHLRRNHAQLNARLHLAGTMLPVDKPFIKAQEKKLRTANLTADVTWSFNIPGSEKYPMLSRWSVLSVPANYGESFGLYVLEANLAGVPVVQPNTAAFPEVLNLTGGGVLCEPDNPVSLADALADLLADEPRRAELGASGREAVRTQLTSTQMATQVAAALEQLCQTPHPEPKAPIPASV